MRIIDKNETIIWLFERGFSDSKGMLSLSGYDNSMQFKIPVDSGKKTALSKMIASFIDDDNEALLWINEYGIWPSSEDQNLFLGFRRSLCEHSSLFEKPGHILSHNDLETLGSLLAMILYFCWGAVLVSTAKSIIIKISHDETIDVFVKDRKSLADIDIKINNIVKA